MNNNKFNIEEYRGLVDHHSNTMKSTDLHRFIYEVTGKHEELTTFHRVVKDSLFGKENHMNTEISEDTDFSLTLDARGYIKYYSLSETHCNMVMTSMDVGHLELLAEVFVKVKNSLPTNYLEALQALIVEVEAKEEALKVIEANKPSVQFAHAIEVTVSPISIGAFGQILAEEHRVKISQNKLMAWMKNKRIIIKSGRRKNTPTQKYITNEYFQVNTRTHETPYGTKEVTTTLITGKGQVGLTKAILQHFRG